MNILGYLFFYRKINRSGLFYRNLFVSLADVDLSAGDDRRRNYEYQIRGPTFLGQRNIVVVIHLLSANVIAGFVFKKVLNSLRKLKDWRKIFEYFQRSSAKRK